MTTLPVHSAPAAPAALPFDGPQRFAEWRTFPPERKQAFSTLYARTAWTTLEEDKPIARTGSFYQVDSANVTPCGNLRLNNGTFNQSANGAKLQDRVSGDTVRLAKFNRRCKQKGLPATKVWALTNYNENWTRFWVEIGERVVQAPLQNLHRAARQPMVPLTADLLNSITPAAMRTPAPADVSFLGALPAPARAPSPLPKRQRTNPPPSLGEDLGWLLLPPQPNHEQEIDAYLMALSSGGQNPPANEVVLERGNIGTTVEENADWVTVQKISAELASQSDDQFWQEIAKILEPGS